MYPSTVLPRLGSTETALSVLTNCMEEEDEEDYEYERSRLDNTLVTLYSIHHKV